MPFASIFGNSMLFKQCLALGILASLSLAATAQQAPHQPGPLDVNAPVPAPAYASAFNSYQGATDSGETPDKIWRSANDEVGRLGGHAGHMNGADARASQAAPARPAAPPRPVPMHHGHQHQRMD